MSTATEGTCPAAPGSPKQALVVTRQLRFGRLRPRRWLLPSPSDINAGDAEREMERVCQGLNEAHFLVVGMCQVVPSRTVFEHAQNGSLAQLRARRP